MPRSGSESSEPSAAPLGQTCDFCGDVVSTVRRVALDGNYDRLQKAHQERYSCPSCFESKEKDRLGLGPR